MSHSINQLLTDLAQSGDRSVVLMPGSPPLFIRKQVERPSGPELSRDECKELILALLTDEQRDELSRKNSVQVTFGIKGFGRYRMQAKLEAGFVAGTIEIIERWYQG